MNDVNQNTPPAAENGKEEDVFVPIKDGLYRARLVKAKKQKSKQTERPMIQFTWELQEPPYGGKKLNSYLVTDSEKALYVLDLMAQYLLGDDYEEDEFDWEEDLGQLVRRECLLQVEKIDLSGRQYNNVRRYYPLSHSPQ